jgi:Protein of unknown function (DUF2793)
LTTERLGFEDLIAGQADAYIRYNENLRKLEALLGAVESKTVTAPPSAPTAGQVWIVPSGATGIWAGKTDQLAHWYNGAWHYYVPCDRLRHWVKDTDVSIIFKAGAGWV